MRLKYAIFSHKGGALLVSDNAGNGKTSVLARLKNDLTDYYSGRVRVVFIDHPTLTPIEIIGEIAHQLGAELYTTEKIRALNHLRDRLFSLYNENIKVVVIVDEGQMLKDRADLLGELRILLNFCVADSFLLTFIFSGQKPLDTILREMPEFWQRLPVRFFLKNLDYNDTKALIQFRLDKVGLSEDIFTEDAFDGIYKYSDGCPRIICSVADLCLIIGFAKGMRRIGFVEATTACRDMESSGDGFHYYAYIKSQQYNLFQDPVPVEPPPAMKSIHAAKPKTSANTAPAAQKKSHQKPATPIDDINSVSCPQCAEANPKDQKFCRKCSSPIYRKCPACSSLIDTVSNICPSCKADIDAESNKLLEKVEKELFDYDILAEGSGLWLASKKIELEKEENVIIIFPKGNAFNGGPVVVSTSKTRTSPKEPCDFILTNKRLMISKKDKVLKTELKRIDSCMPVDTGKLFGKRHLLIISFNNYIYRISLPHGSRKSKAILKSISAFIQQVMLK